MEENRTPEWVLRDWERGKGEGRTRAPELDGCLGAAKASLFCTEAEKRNKSHFLPCVISKQRRGKLTRGKKSFLYCAKF